MGAARLGGWRLVRIGAGWLSQDLSLPDHNHGVYVPRFSQAEQAPFGTRTEEYFFAASALEEEIRGVVVDAGCGFNPEIHVLPEILAKMGYGVYAIDANPVVLNMPPVTGVARACGTMAFLSQFADGTVDHWVCISVLEHLEPSLRVATMMEARRVLKPGGLTVMTMDDIDPEKLVQVNVECGFESGPIYPMTGQHLTPCVSWSIGRKI